jgi:hypothetical protein
MGLESIHVGIDIGQTHDPSAIVAAEVWTDEHTLTRYLVQHMERLRIGMSYPEQAQYIVKLLGAILRMLEVTRQKRLAELRKQVIETGEQIMSVPSIDLRVWVDITGVGRPVYEMITGAASKDPLVRSVEFKPITFRGGADFDRLKGLLGKAYLVSRLQALLQNQQVGIPPNHEEADAIKRELKDYAIKVRQDATAEYGALSTGQHDDLVTALGLCTLEDPNGSGRGSLRTFELAR